MLHSQRSLAIFSIVILFSVNLAIAHPDGVALYGIPYSDFGIVIANPYLTVPVSRGEGGIGEFRFEGVPPGRYTVACLLDVNRNGFPEPGVDLIAGPSGKILEVR